LQAAKNQDFERALQELECFGSIGYRRHSTYLRLPEIPVKRKARMNRQRSASLARLAAKTPSMAF
jgi:hypothetical protein